MVFVVGGMDVWIECCLIECGVYIIVVMLGCLCDYIVCGVIDLSDLWIVVFDEVDEMLDMGFVEDFEYIFD